MRRMHLDLPPRITLIVRCYNLCPWIFSNQPPGTSIHSKVFEQIIVWRIRYIDISNFFKFNKSCSLWDSNSRSLKFFLNIARRKLHRPFWQALFHPRHQLSNQSSSTPSKDSNSASCEWLYHVRPAAYLEFHEFFSEILAGQGLLRADYAKLYFVLWAQDQVQLIRFWLQSDCDTDYRIL